MANEVANTTKFELAVTRSGIDETMLSEYNDELSDLGDGGINYRSIKLPFGKVKQFTIESDNPDDPDIAKELTGVIVFTHQMNVMYEEYGSENKVPICSSWDAKVGFNTKTNKNCSCDRCPHNQFRDNGSGIIRKECKNSRRIYLMLDGKPDLYMLTVPPTSLKDVRMQINRIMSSCGKPYTSMVLSFSLVGAVSKGGQDFSKIAIRKVGDLAPEQAETVRQMREELKESYKSVIITSDDYYTQEPEQTSHAPEPATDANGFVSIPDGIPEELPFN